MNINFKILHFKVGKLARLVKSNDFEFESFLSDNFLSDEVLDKIQKTAKGIHKKAVKNHYKFEENSLLPPLLQDYVDKSISFSELYQRVVKLARIAHDDYLNQKGKVKDGTMVLVHFTDLLIEGDTYDALGIYKLQSAKEILHTSDVDAPILISGVNTVDYCALILPNEYGSDLWVSDKEENKETNWFTDLFLKAVPAETNHTSELLSILLRFLSQDFWHPLIKIQTEKLITEHFSHNTEFYPDRFRLNVLGSDHLINGFDDFCTSQEYDLPDEFKINQDTVQTFFKKNFNSVIQLDRNFILDVRTHDPRVQEERLAFGEDENGEFLKVYFTDVETEAV